MTTALGKALREKYRSPQEAIRALGLDESLLNTEQRQMSNAKKPTRLAYLTLMRTAAGVNPLLAMDAKIDYGPIFNDLTRKNFKAADVMTKLRAATKGKLIAKDEGMEHVGAMLKKVEEAAPAEASLDESVSEAQHNAMGAAAGGKSNLDIPQGVGKEFMKADKGKGFDEATTNFFKGKGFTDQDIATAQDMIFKKEVDPAPPDLTPGGAIPGKDAGEEVKAQRETEESKIGDDRRADDRRADDRRADDRRADDRRADDRRADDRRADDRRADDKRADDKRADDRRADDRRADDKRADDAYDNADDKRADDKRMGKDEVNKAISDAIAATRAAERGVRTALAQVKPWVGEIPVTMSFDSAEQVHRHAAKMLKIRNADTLHSDALWPIIENYPKPGARPPVIAQDTASEGSSADAMASFKEMFGEHAVNIATGG